LLPTSPLGMRSTVSAYYEICVFILLDMCADTPLCCPRRLLCALRQVSLPSSLSLSLTLSLSPPLSPPSSYLGAWYALTGASLFRHAHKCSSRSRILSSLRPHILQLKAA
jgi:hypothetical protein